MTDQVIIKLVGDLNLEVYEQTQKCDWGIHPFEFLSDGDEVCITFMGRPWYCSADYPQLDTENSIADLKKTLHGYLEALKAIDLDKLVACLPQPQPEE